MKSRTLRWLFRLPLPLYRHNLGWLLGRHLLAVTHIGRRTGVVHTTVVEVVERASGSDEYIVMVAFGRTSDWYRNIEANPPSEAVVGCRSFAPAWRELSNIEGAAILGRYEARRWWWGPLLPWLMSMLIGERYVSTPASRLEVVRERPMIALRPVDDARRDGRVWDDE